MSMTLTGARCAPSTRCVLLLALLVAGVARAAEFDCLIEARRTVVISGPVEALIANVKACR
jgi:high-affinity K+ transport system ATPase subunit B